MKQVIVLFILACMAISCSKNIGPTPQFFSFSPGKGTEGNIVRIRGKDFGTSASNIRVYFNGVAATTLSLSDTLISVTVPPGTTTGRIAISKYGETVLSDQDFVILPGHWTRKADHPSDFPARVLAAGFAINGKGYFGLGYDGGAFLTDMISYDPATDSWTGVASSPGSAMQSPVSIVINNKAYIGIGKTDNSTTPEFWEYDPGVNSWMRKADLPDTISEGAFGVGLGNKGYAGISPDKNGMKGWWEYNPANNNWSAKADFPGSVMEWPCGFALHGKIYLGLDHLHAPQEWWQYDTTNNVWARKADFPGNLDFAPKGFTMGDKGYVMGGLECWQYNDQSDSWTQMGFFDFRTGGSAFVIGDKGYYVGGRGGPSGLMVPEIWEFDPAR